MRAVRRGGRHFRIADPDWDNPLDGSYAARFGGRWNPPRSFPVCYLNADLATARANARHFLERRLAVLPITVDDVDPDELPILVTTNVRHDDFVDVVTSDGCRAAGLPPTYPLGGDGAPVGWDECQPVGRAAWNDGWPGIAGRSAAVMAPPDGEELAWFQRAEPLNEIDRHAFLDWYGAVDWP